MSDSGDALLKVEELCAGYGKVRILHEVDLCVNSGESVAVLGPNNAGKTTLLRCLSGIVPVTSGRCFFNSINLESKSSADRVNAGIIQVPEGRHLFTDLSVEDNLRVGSSRLPRALRGEQLSEVYDQLPMLATYRAKQAGMLSGGQQQMVAIGRALAAKPRLLIVDEPSLGLSPVAVDGVIETLQQLQRQDMTMLVVEQSATLAVELCSRGYVLRQGSIVVTGDSQHLQSDEVQKAYLS